MARRKKQQSWLGKVLGGLLHYVVFGPAKPQRHRTRWKPGSKMYEIHQRHLERVRREAEEKAERRRAREERRRARLQQEAQAKEERRRKLEEAKAARLESVRLKAERGELRGAELAELMRSGLLRFRNPGLSPEEKAELAAAISLSERFHGTPVEVIELSDDERLLPRFAMAAGEIDGLSYEPCLHSTRGRIVWDHRSGDMGFGRRAAGRPLLAVDPKTKRPFLVRWQSKMKLDPSLGLVK